MNEHRAGRVGAGPDPDVAPGNVGDQAHDPRRLAREQYAHGLLSFLHLDGAERQERRIARVMESIGEHRRRRADFDGTAGRTVIGRIVPWQRLSGLAAAVLIAAIVLFFLVPTEQSATATVQTSLEALRKGGDRRYEVKAILPNREAPQSIATIDIRDASHLLVRARSPRGDRVTMGRDEQGKWVIKPDGELDRFPPRQAWPKWLDVGENTVLLESVDSQLEDVLKNYELKRTEDAALPGTSAGASGGAAAANAMYSRVTATWKLKPGPEPERIELWIERDTRLVKRMELHWPERQWRPNGPGPGGGGPGGGGGGGGEPRPPRGMRPPMDGGPERPGGRRMPEGQPSPDANHEPGQPGEGPSGDRMGQPPPGPGPQNRPGPRRPRPEGAPPPPGPDGFGPPPDGDPLGLGPGGPGGPGPRHPRPQFLDGPPEFGPGADRPHPPPPRVMVFERVDAPAFESGWFSPEAHVGKAEAAKP